jgi:hypothetical protein
VPNYLVIKGSAAAPGNQPAGDIRQTPHPERQVALAFIN